MIKTIEIAPEILAAELAKYLNQSFYLYETKRAAIWDEPFTEQELAQIIREFLNGT